MAFVGVVAKAELTAMKLARAEARAERVSLARAAEEARAAAQAAQATRAASEAAEAANAAMRSAQTTARSPVLGSIDDYLDPIKNKDFIASEVKKAKSGVPGHLIGSADTEVAARAAKITKEPGYTDLIVHCDDEANVFAVKTSKGDIALTPKDVSDYLQSLNLPPNEGIRLISCNAGYSPNGPRAALRSQLGARRMKVAPAPVAIEVDGSLHFVNPGVVEGKYSVYDPNLTWKDLP